MQINQLTGLQSVLPVKPENKPASGQSANFGELLNQAVKKLNQVQSQADETVGKFLAGEVKDLHEVTIEMQEAKLSMQLAVEVRNKVVEAYQEILRMQV